MAETKSTKKTKPREVTGRLERAEGTTLKVRVERKYPHPKYSKIIKTHKNYIAHFEGKKKDINVGDEVLIQECKPVSSKKTWRFVKVTKKVQ